MLFVAAEDGRCGGHAFIWWWCRLASSACGGVQDATAAMAASIREAADSPSCGQQLVGNGTGTRAHAERIGRGSWSLRVQTPSRGNGRQARGKL